MGNFLRQLFKRLTTSKSKPNPFLRPPQLTYLEERITPSNSPIIVTTTLLSVAGSLDAAIAQANATAGDDTIVFASSLFTNGPATISLTGVLPAIADATTAGTLTITGPGANTLNINGNNGNFSIFSIVSLGNLSISGVTVSGANTSGFGGAFNNAGVLAISTSTISGNSAIAGGGIFNQGTALTISDSTISGNFASAYGGGINNFNGGTISVSNSTISNNSATNGGGGGIINTNSTLTVLNSTIYGNTTLGNGGGVLNFSGSSTLSVINSTLSGNSATSGGGIQNNATINNLVNTIIANSTSGGDFAGTAPNTNTNNLVEDGSLTGASIGDPRLGPLQNNGGPTLTMALGAGSPAIKTAAGTGTDQRGINRTTSDIGAYSFGIQVTNTTDNLTSPSVGSLRAAINLANTTAGNDQISFNLTGSSPYTITLAGALPTILDAAATASGTGGTGTTVGTLTITGLGASSLTISGSDPTNPNNANRNFNIFNIAFGGNLSISGVTVSGAKTSGNGGAFDNFGTLAVSNSTLSGNIANNGGGFYNSGIATVTNSTISGNSANTGGGAGNIGTLTITNSTLSGNSALNIGGALFNGLTGNLILSNSTLSGNSASGNGGGGIYNLSTATVTNSTLSGNSANHGAGIYNYSGLFNTATLNIANTIIANSTNGLDYAGGGDVNLIGSSTKLNNLVTQTGSLVSDWATTKTSAEINLGPLQNNGGPTFTMALLNGSYAINRGNSTISNTAPINGLDQRGFARTTSDIGAYSYNFASAGDVVVSLDNSNQVVLTLSSSGTTLTDVHTSFNSVNNTLTITAATSGTLLTAPAAGIAGISIINGSTDSITLDLNTLTNFAGLVIVGNSGLDSVTIGTGGVDLSAVTTGAANQSFTANILGTSTSTSALALSNAIKTKGTAATYLSAGTINGSGLITTSSITLAASTGIGNTTALNLAAASIAADSTTGKIDVANTLSTTVTVSSLTTKYVGDPSTDPGPGGSLITFNQSGGGTVTFNNVSTANSTAGKGWGAITLVNAGGGITVASTGVSSATTTSTISLTTTGSGNIAVNAPINGGLNDGNVSLTSAGNISGSGLITGSQASLVANTGINANANFSQGFSAISSAAGDIIVANVYGIAVPNAIIATGNVTLTSQQQIAVLNPITATGKIVTLTANGGDVDGTSLITANTVDLNATAGIGSTGAINLAAFFVSADTTTGAIDINNTSGTAVSVTSLTTTGTDGITFDQTGGGLINITGPVIPGTGALAISGSTINLNNNVTTTNNNQTYTGNVVVNANSGGLPLTLSAGSGAINITGNIDSAASANHRLTINATGDVILGGTIGGTQALGALLITGNDISLGNVGGASAGTTVNLSVQASDGADNGSITLTGTIYNTTGQQFYNALVTNPILLNGGSPGSPGSTISLTSATGIETYGTIQLNNRVLSLNTSSGISGFVTNDSQSSSLQVFEGPGSVVIDTGVSGSININGAIGTSSTPLNALTITNAKNAFFSGALFLNELTITDVTDAASDTGLVNFNGNLTVNNSLTVSPGGNYDVQMIGASNTIAGQTTFGNEGSLSFGNTGDDTFNFTGGIIATAPSAINLIGTVTAAVTGIITLGDSGTPLNVKNGNGFVGGTSNGIITLGNAILEDGVTLTVGTGIANVINMAAVTGTAGGIPENLIINTTGAVTVAGAVGTDIGTLTITNSGGTTFLSTVAAATATITNTTGTVKFEGNLNLTTSLVTAAQGYNVSITGNNNSIAGATTFLNTGTVALGNGTNDSTTFAGGLVITAPSAIAIQGTVRTTDTTMTLGDANTGVTLSANTTLNAGSGIINLDGVVSGSFELTPTTSAPGITTISRANTNATTNVTTGVVQISNTQSTNYVVSGGTLKGTGTIRTLTATGGIIAPGNSAGKITTTSLDLSSGNILQIEIQGANSSPVAGNDYDQIVVSSSGTVNLGGATLSLSTSFGGDQGTVFTIIDNQHQSASIQGTFAGLSEGGVITANGRAYKISYRGGTSSNDVTLTVYDPATVTSFSPTIGKTGTSVVITGSNFTNVSQVSFNGTVQPTYTVNPPTQITTTVPSGATTGTISITTIAGIATSTSSFTVDNTAPTLSISANPGSLKANETSTITFTFSEVVTGFSSSIITVTNGTLSSPVASSSTVYTAIFTPTLGIKADGTISVSNNYFDSVGNQGTAATLTPPIAINTIQTPLVTGSASTTQGGSSVVSLVDPDTGAIIGSAVPFPDFTGEIRVVSGDFNNDGKVDIIAAAGPGGGPAVSILDSETGEVLESFFAFDPAFTGGVFIAVRDFNGDGILDIIAGAGAGGGPEVRIFNGDGLTVIKSFFAYAEDFTGGVSVASVDFNNDGILDLVTGAGPTGAPHVKVYDGDTNAIISQWYAYPVSFTGGVYVAAGDIGNDGNIEVVTGAGSGGAPVVAVWDPYTGALLAQFMAYAEDFTGGVRVGVSDGNFDGVLDLITGAGPGGGPQVNGFSFPTLDLLFSFFSGDPSSTGGVFVS